MSKKAFRSLETARADREFRAALDAAVNRPELKGLTFGPSHPERSWVVAKAIFENPAGPADKRYDLVRGWLADHDAEMQALDPERRMRCFDDKNRPRTRSLVHNPTLAAERAEVRDSSTASASLGTFTPPLWYPDLFALWAQYFGTVLGQAYRPPMGMPPTGMTIYAPFLTESASMVANQTAAGENTTVQITSPTAGNRIADIQTFAGGLEVSYPLLERGGQPGADGMSFDREVALQFAVDYAAEADAFLIAQMLANAISVTDNNSYSTGPDTVAGYWLDIANAASQIETTAGSHLVATHAFWPPASYRWLAGQVDAQNRPVFGPDAPGVLPNGDTQTSVGNVRSYIDGNIPAAGSDAQVLVANMHSAVWAFEGEPIVDVHYGTQNPSTGAGLAMSATAWIGFRRYYANWVRYPKAVAVVSGSALPASPSF